LAGVEKNFLPYYIIDGRNSFSQTFRCRSAGEDDMKKIWVIPFLLLLSSCKETPSQPQQLRSRIVAYVHWEGQALSGKQIELIETGETKFTDSNGLAEFSVPDGKYIIRAYGINGPGPALQTIDFNVEVRSGETMKVDIIDCLPCV
jgi:hypothetical protein